MGALDDVNVLDLSWSVIGPMTTRHLADYGATVVRVESRTRMDAIRTESPFKDDRPGTNRSGYFANFNANKYDITLNLSTPEAQEIVHRLVTWADVVAEAVTPGVVEKLGLGYDALRRIKPDIIMFSTSLMGRGGPYSQARALGGLTNSLAGFTHLTGWPDRAPSSFYGACTDFVAVAIIAALDHRRRTGQGQYLDLSQLEGALHLVAPVIMEYAANGHLQSRAGNLHPAAAPHNTYRCRGEDRWCAIACLSDEECGSLCRLMSQPQLAEDPRFATALDRKRNEDALDALVEDWTQEQDAHEVMSACQDAGVPAGVVQTPEEVYNDPQLAHRGHFVYLDHPELGRHANDGSCFTLSKTPAEYRMAGPLLGQHTNLVLHQFLGLSDQEIAALERSGALD